MNDVFCSIIVCCVCFNLAWSQNNLQDITSLHNAYCKAVEQKDSAFLKKLFHDNMVVTSGNGIKRSKAEEIHNALDPRFKVNFFKSRNLDIRTFGETVILTGELFWEFEYEGKTSSLERSFTFTYARTAGEWRIVAQHIGRVPSPASK